MTGYGKADLEITGYRVGLEIRSVNHRFCEISVQNLPQDLRFLETKLKKLVSRRFSRGHFYLSFQVMPMENEFSFGNIYLNEEALERCFLALSGIKKKLGLTEEVSLTHLLQLQDKFVQKMPGVDFKEFESKIESLLQKAMSELDRMREEEGKSLASDLQSHLLLIKSQIGEIERYREGILQNYKNRLLKKLDELKSILEMDPQRLAQEVVLYSDRMDIQEEISRLISHLSQFEKMIQGNEPSGRGMDFLLQEMNREINTIGSKTGGTPTTLFVKQELEILREQVQNVE
ncbi:MAG: YicC family protein [Nitrospirae bacterium]|nr:YicC family protein [Nitrospirota bacterium]